VVRTTVGERRGELLLRLGVLRRPTLGLGLVLPVSRAGNQEVPVDVEEVELWSWGVSFFPYFFKSLQYSYDVRLRLVRFISLLCVFCFVVEKSARRTSGFLLTFPNDCESDPSIHPSIHTQLPTVYNDNQKRSNTITN
jgi:hypothetical protein